jgi:bifunctional non-homologous end joining protein LigD
MTTDPIAPMLATAAAGALPAGPGWGWEFKWDGQRGGAALADGQLLLRARPRLRGSFGSNITATYPELAELVDRVNGRSMVLDGEIVALVDGRPSFNALQHRMGATATKYRRQKYPVCYHVFDLLSLDGQRVTDQPYTQRRALLDGLGLPTCYGRETRIVVPPYMVGLDGMDLLGVAAEHGLEGVVGKRLTSIYEPGVRSPNWMKKRVRKWST